MVIEEPKLYGKVGLSYEDLQFVYEEMNQNITKENAEKFLEKYDQLIYKTMLGEGLELLKLIVNHEDQFQDLL